ncbi:F0F1 ATP synthase subunit delta [Candidatus Williamhamiltonella defendens]|uniref:F0F1 ATP synthase subunit delta n=1 Tax=Candidatus Williamhamiltonella defendens TaxID=138072 RepID=UPI001583DFF1|nr:F0F1 ATP synthase subunit delta [Candidatus Hamiltonella defensa]
MSMATIARPYAKAIFDFAVEHHSIEHWQNMLAFSAQVSAHKQVTQWLSGVMHSEKTAQIFISLCSDHLDEFSKNFIKIMAQNGRLSLLPEVLKQFMALRAMINSVIDIEVFSAIPLNEDQKKKIIFALEKRLQLKVTLNCKIDSSILAGVIIRHGDRVIDGSVSNRLKRLKNFLLS